MTRRQPEEVSTLATRNGWCDARDGRRQLGVARTPTTHPEWADGEATATNQAVLVITDHGALLSRRY